MLIKTFRLSRYRLLSLTVDGSRAVAHWRVDIHSKVIGVMLPTELVDPVDVRVLPDGVCAGAGTSGRLLD